MYRYWYTYGQDFRLLILTKFDSILVCTKDRSTSEWEHGLVSAAWKHVGVVSNKRMDFLPWWVKDRTLPIILIFDAETRILQNIFLFCWMFCQAQPSSYARENLLAWRKKKLPPCHYLILIHFPTSVTHPHSFILSSSS